MKAEDLARPARARDLASIRGENPFDMSAFQVGESHQALIHLGWVRRRWLAEVVEQRLCQLEGAAGRGQGIRIRTPQKPQA